jgi:hypothetical protein
MYVILYDIYCHMHAMDTTAGFHAHDTFYCTLPPALIISMAFTLETQIVIKWGDPTQTWAPKQCEVDGMRFFEFSKWDRGLVKFATGRSLDLRKGAANKASVDCEFLDKVLTRRQLCMICRVTRSLQRSRRDAGAEHAWPIVTCAPKSWR